MRAALVLVMACGCAAYVGPKSPRDALLTGDYAQLVRGNVTNAGLWFEDPACAAKFGKPGPIAEPDLAAFAQCLADLHLQPSPREHSLVDVAIMTYGPGLEVEVRVIPEAAGPRLSWIGFEAKLADDDVLPTVSSAAIEALRLEGDRDGPLDPKFLPETGIRPRRISPWVKFCIDEHGAVTAAHPYETSTELGDALVPIVLAWRFKPFTLAGQPSAVCSMARLELPPRSGLRPESLPGPGEKNALLVPPQTLEPLRLRGTKAIVPDDGTKIAIQKAHQQAVRGTFKLCLHETGDIQSVRMIESTGFDAYDDRIRTELRNWRYKPYLDNGKATHICTAVTFIYRVR